MGAKSEHSAAVRREMAADRVWDQKHGIREGSWQDQAIDKAAAARAGKK